MKRVALKIAASRTADRDDHDAMAKALDRLHQAALNTAGDVVANLSISERAKLAVHCYGRTHLNAIGLAIAAQCDLDHLIAAANSATAGQMIYVQSRESGPAEKPLYGRRAITLAKSAPAPAASFVPDALSA